LRAVALVLALLIACPAWMLAAVGGPALPNPGLAAPRDQQVQLGQKAVAEVYKQMPVLPDSSPVTRYIQDLGRRLDSVIPEQYNWPYQFHVVEQKDINAFALPGGPVFVNVGTILAADNEAELAGVIAHEMSHVYMQHSVKQMQKSTGPSLIAGLGQILGSIIGGPAGAIAAVGGQIGGGILSMKYSRTDEAQADEVGAIIMYKAGYNPLYLAQFFQKLEQEGGAGGPQFLSDHPNPGNRMEAIKNEIKNWPAETYRNDRPQFVQAKQEARSVPAYTAQQIQEMAKTGQIRNTGAPAGVQAGPGTMGPASESEVMPSGSMQQYQGPFFTIEGPSNWQPQQDQQSGTVVITPPAGISQSGIAYGALISQFQPQGASSLDRATQQLIASLQQQNPGLKAAGKTQEIRVNGIAGQSVDLLGTSPIAGANGQSLQERDWLVSLPGANGSLVYMVFISPEKDFQRLRPTFEQMLRSFHLNQ
jgi:Zn-dependent protease with chaperone function